ncbi:MAG: hypothetical protein Crog4KO_19580 [Crocinitomicaceae bacterium]
MSEKLISQKGTLTCTVSSLNIRGGSPSTSAPIVGSLKKGQTADYTGYVENGSAVRGNSKWYKGTNNQYYWSGGVKAKPSANSKSSDAPSESNISAAVGAGAPNKKPDVTLVQTLLKDKGVSVGTVDGLFGNQTRRAIINFQKGGLGFNNADGRVDPGGKTWKGLNDPSVKYTEPTSTSDDDFNTKYKDVIFKGSVFPDKPIYSNLKVSLNDTMKKEYLPAMEKALAGSPKGLKLLCTVMAHKEGFRPGTRAYRTNNPGNIGNTDAGSNVALNTLEDGIRRQRDYINRIVAGKNSAYPMGKRKLIKPYYSPEIARNPQYGLPAWLPGYDFVFTAQLDQFVKIYATGARAGNSYLSTIISYFKANGIEINAQSKIGDIIK